jgi:hypothetical protein
MFLHGEVVWLSKDDFLHQDVEYDLYFQAEKDEWPEFSKIMVVITNIFHPSSSDEESLLCQFGFYINEWGVSSTRCLAAYDTRQEAYGFYEGQELEYFGSYTMLFAWSMSLSRGLLLLQNPVGDRSRD